MTFFHDLGRNCISRCIGYGDFMNNVFVYIRTDRGYGNRHKNKKSIEDNMSTPTKQVQTCASQERSLCRKSSCLLYLCGDLSRYCRHILLSATDNHTTHCLTC